MEAVAARLLDQLYAVQPSAFTRERNAKAAALEKAGRRAEARALRQLRRPPASLWATNRLAYVEAKRLGAFLDAVDRVRRSQLRDPRAAGEAMQRQRAELRALADRARELLAEQGYRATAATDRRISNTLLGAAVDRRRAQDLWRGRLTDELSAPGFEVLSGAGRSTVAGRSPDLSNLADRARRAARRRPG